jgi:hypothetical protein
MGDHDTAALLRAIQRIMTEHGVTHERLRAILPAYKFPTGAADPQRMKRC